MDIRFLAPELHCLDTLKCEALLAPFFSDERPLAGALGLVDWRMCGFLSRAIERGDIRGEPLETVLVPLRPRFTIDKLFLFGLGPEKDFGPSVLLDVTTRMLSVVARAKVRTTACVLPGRSTRRIDPIAAMEGFVAASHAHVHGEQDEVILIEPLEAQRQMEPIVQRERRRARAAGS